VAEEQRDDRCVHARVEEAHGGRIAQHVRRDLLGSEGWAPRLCGVRVLGDE
jgi:hypothetical protein